MKAGSKYLLLEETSDLFWNHEFSVLLRIISKNKIIFTETVPCCNKKKLTCSFDFFGTPGNNKFCSSGRYVPILQT